MKTTLLRKSKIATFVIRVVGVWIYAFFGHSAVYVHAEEPIRMTTLENVCRQPRATSNNSTLSVDQPTVVSPNFVWLISEDNSKHFLKLFDEHGAETPHIAALAKDGLIFRRAFSNGAVCSVARSTLITSCYAPRIGAEFHRRAQMVPLPDGVRMFPEYLRRAGYYTTNNAKTDYNLLPGDEVWDESSNTASWKNRKANQPFFHKQTFKVSHEGALHFSKSVFNDRKTETDPNTVFVPDYLPQTDLFKYTYARYHDRIRLVDQAIGNVIKRLTDDGLLESTFIFYFGDHGGVLPRSKGYAYETGLHVPLVVRIPENFRHLVDAERGQSIDGFVSFVDFGPTLLHLAGLPIPKKIDGQPFMGPDVSKTDLNQRDETFGYADRFDEKYDLVRTIRKGNLKYVRNFQPFNFDGLQNNYRYKMLAYAQWRKLFDEGKLDEKQSQFFRPREPEATYDLSTDPYETRNLAVDSRFKKKLLSMRELLTNQVKSMPDLSFYPEDVLVRDAFSNPVSFGEKNKNEISRMVDIANLCLKDFDAAKTQIESALNSKQPWDRYWGLIVCSCFGRAAGEFADKVKTLAADDKHLLVRVRAAEFLGLANLTDPRPTILDCLNRSESPVEALLIFNTLVLLRDGSQGWAFDTSILTLKPDVAKIRRSFEEWNI